MIVKVTANLSGDREARRHWQADPRHLMEICAFAAQQRFHRACSISMPVAEVIHTARCVLSFSSCDFVRFTSRRFPRALESLSNVRFYFAGHKFGSGSCPK